MTSSESPPFRHGDAVMYRDLGSHREIRSVLPVRVVRDDPGCVVLWLPLGVPSMKPTLIHHTPRTPRSWHDGNWFLQRSTWNWAELLIIARDRECRATWVRWSADRTFQGWAVNLQSPLIRTRIGFDHCDRQLDIMVEPDRSWTWKDQDELELAVETGRMTREQADSVRDESGRAVSDIENNRSPFGDGWESWKPDGSWPQPALREDWADVSMHTERGWPASWGPT